MHKTYVYIDGFNFYYGCIRNSPYRWLDLFKFAQSMLPKNEVVRVKHFTAIVKSSAKDPSKVERQRTFLRALATIPEIEVDIAVVVSNDSDLVAPIRAVRTKLQKTVGIINPHQRQSVELRGCASFIKEVRTWTLAQSLHPTLLRDANGEFHKPVGW